MTLPPPVNRPEPDWHPGDPLYGVDVSFNITPVLSEPCPPGCWCHAVPVGGYAVRWTTDDPVLRFLPDGLHVTGRETDDDIYVRSAG
jgi:hypothetical protein